MRMYRLYLPLGMRILCCAAPIFPFVFALPFFFGAFDTSPGGAPPRMVGVVPFAIGLFYAYWVYSTPHRIVFHDTGHVEFISVLRRWRFDVQDIRSIRTSRSMMGFLVVRTSRGTVTLLNQFDGFHEFIVGIRNANPRIELRGC